MRDMSHGLIEARVPGGGPPGTIIGAQLALALSLALTLSVSGQRFALAYLTPKRLSILLSNRVPSPTPKRPWM